MSLSFYPILLSDCVLALALLILFSYVSKVSNGLRGIALWGIGHFIYSIGAVLVDGSALNNLSPVFHLPAGIVASAGLALLTYAIYSFSQQKKPSFLLRLLLGFMVTLPGLLFLAGLQQVSNLSVAVNEVIFILVMMNYLRLFEKQPFRLPSIMMILAAIPLLAIYLQDIFNIFHDQYTGEFGSFSWINVDLSAWFLINFCMLTLSSFKASENLKQVARLDPLTGLLNRRGLRENLNMAAPFKYPMAVLALDIDFFKSINDQYGHHTGDLVLQEFSRKLQHITDCSDILARVGGEEFIIVVQGPKAANAHIFAECLRAEVESMLVSDSKTFIPITVSIGVCITHRPEKISVLIHAADEQLYRAKDVGRNCIVTHTLGKEATNTERKIA